jgi:predicted nucleic acid-binding Zn ribbon protein
MARKCIQCQAAIKGRVDKKFCDDACRNVYNNERRRYQSNTVRRINQILSKNRRILEEFNPRGRCKCRRQELVLQGFDFSHFTSISESKKGQRCHYIYDQGYIILDDEWIRLIRAQTRERK